MKKYIILSVVILIILVLALLITMVLKNNNKNNNNNNNNNVIIGKTIYNYPHNTSIIILDNGDVEKGTTIDELNVDGTSNSTEYKKIKTITDNELENLKSMIQDIKNYKQSNREDYSKDIGLFIKIDGENYSTVYYDQEKVDKLNDYFESLIK